MAAPKQICPTTARLYLSHTATQTPTLPCRNLPFSRRAVRRHGMRLQRPSSPPPPPALRRLPVRVIRNHRRCSRVRLLLVSSIIRFLKGIYVMLLQRNLALRWIRSVASPSNLIYTFLTYLPTFVFFSFLATNVYKKKSLSLTYGIPRWAKIVTGYSWGITSASKCNQHPLPCPFRRDFCVISPQPPPPFKIQLSWLFLKKKGGGKGGFFHYFSNYALRM